LDFKAKHILESLHLAADLEKWVEWMEALSKEVLIQLRESFNIGKKLQKSPDPDTLASISGGEFFPNIMGKGDLLGVGSVWINRWVQGIKYHSSKGLLPILIKFWVTRSEVSEELEFLSIIMQ